MEELIPFGIRPSQARFTQNSWLFLRSFLILYRFQGSLLSSELVHNTTCSLFCQHFFWSFFTFFASFLKTLIFQRVQVCSICAFLSSAPDFFVISGHFVAFLLTLYAIFTQYPFFHAPPAPLPLQSSFVISVTFHPNRLTFSQSLAYTLSVLSVLIQL